MIQCLFVRCLSVRQSVCLSHDGILPAAGRVITQSNAAQ